MIISRPMVRSTIPLTQSGIREGFTFDDVLLIPAYSDIETRSKIDLSQAFLGFYLGLPIISANMDYVTGVAMAKAMVENGGYYVLHRFAPLPEIDKWVMELDAWSNYTPVSFSVGIRNPDYEFGKVKYMVEEHGISVHNLIVTVDVAHGHHAKVGQMVERLKTYGVRVIAGNVATGDGYHYLADRGADAIKVGIGPGSVCTTRQVTGAGIPQLSAIQYCNTVKEQIDGPPIIADGGIKSSGDIVKALAAGADVVMLGSLLAGTTEAPGEVRVDLNGKRWRPYRGQSIFGVNESKYTPEGIEGWVEERGSVANVLKSLAGGIRSGLSYVGASNIRELRENAQFIKVSPSTHIESSTRIRTEIF